MGGFNETGYVEQIEVYDETSKKWSNYGCMTDGRAGFAATVFEQRIYIAGGWKFVYSSF